MDLTAAPILDVTRVGLARATSWNCASAGPAQRLGVATFLTGGRHV